MGDAFYFIVQRGTGHILERRIQRDDLPPPVPSVPGSRPVRVEMDKYGQIMNDNRWDVMDESRVPPGLRNNPAHDKVVDARRGLSKGEVRQRQNIESKVKPDPPGDPRGIDGNIRP